MATKATTIATLLALNLFFFTFSDAACGCQPKPIPVPGGGGAGGGGGGGAGGGGGERCPIDALKLGVCAKVLGGLIKLPPVTTPNKQTCCSLIQGLADVEAAVCLCTALKANILGINLNVPVDLSLLVNYCGKSIPSGFQCPSS